MISLILNLREFEEQGSTESSYMKRRFIVFIAMATMILCSLGVYLFLTRGISRESGDALDLSRAAEKTAVATTDHSLAGFWKAGGCKDDFGLAISPAGAKLYSVSFCGPSGCFKPGAYLPNTPIFGDDLYRVIDNNTIDVKGSDGFSRYVRCQGR